jgi:PKHD-type hydroxylase
MGVMFPLKLAEVWPVYTYENGVFTPEECDRIINQFGQVLNLAQVGQKEGLESVTPEVRRSHIAWIEYSQDSHWIFERLANHAVVTKDKFWPGWDTHGYVEKLQLTFYSGKDKGHYDWHRDFGAGTMSVRKLSQIVMLSDQNSYKGGKLQFFNIDGKKKDVPAEYLKQGSLITFPSHEPHRVTPLTQGQRWSLVAWIHGPTPR